MSDFMYFVIRIAIGLGVMGLLALMIWAAETLPIAFPAVFAVLGWIFAVLAVLGVAALIGTVVLRDY